MTSVSTPVLAPIDTPAVAERDYPFLVGIGLAACSLAATIAYGIIHLTGYWYGQSLYRVDDYDEGVYRATAALMSHGFQLYGRIYSAQPPGLPVALTFTDLIGGTGQRVARLTILAFAALTLIAVAWIAWHAGGWVAAGIAAALLAASPEFLVYSHAIEEEMPMLALSSLSLLAALWWLRRRKLVALGLAGLLFGLAMMTKFFAFATILPLAAVLAVATWERYQAGRKLRPALADMAVDVLGFVVAAALPLAASLVLLGGDEWRQMVSDRLTAAGHSGGLGAGSNLHQVFDFISTDVGLATLALVGAVLLVAADWRIGIILDSWAVGSLAALLAYHPLMGHHPVILLAPAAAIAGGALAMLWPTAWGRNHLPFLAQEDQNATQQLSYDPLDPGSIHPMFGPPARTMTLSWPFLAVIAGSLVLYLLVIPRLTVSYPGLLVQGPPDPYHAAVASASTIAQSHTGEKRFIVAGDPTICVDSSRLCVPGLVDTSYVRIGTGRLTSAQAIRLTSRRKAKMVFLGRGLCQLKPYDAWVRSNYRLLANMPNLAGGCGGAWIR